jgi:SAM-dependent methyltransferase
MKDHWNKVYETKEVNQLGWYQKSATPSIELLNKCNIKKEDSILDVGVGASTLIDYIIDKGFRNIFATDISKIALNKLQNRLGKDKSSLVNWIVDDITNPSSISKLRNISLWHDRALLHFLIEDYQRQAYLKTLNSVIRDYGYVIIASFSVDGAKKCSGLNIRNYNQNLISEFLGEGFALLEYFNYLYTMPSGAERPYVYTLFQKK